MATIPLSRGYVAIVDDADYAAVAAFKWHAEIDERTVYAKRNRLVDNGHRTTQKLHRFLLGVDDPRIEVDHKDSNGLNNQRNNLRTASKADNQHNSRKRRDGLSKFKGVQWNRGKWQAKITINNQRLHLGRFTDEVMAARAYDGAAKRHYGEFARTNFQ